VVIRSLVILRWVSNGTDHCDSYDIPGVKFPEDDDDNVKRERQQRHSVQISLAFGGGWLVTRFVPDTKKQVLRRSGGNAIASVDDRPRCCRITSVIG
jgi:hypothetical protein